MVTLPNITCYQERPFVLRELKRYDEAIQKWSDIDFFGFFMEFSIYIIFFKSYASAPKNEYPVRSPNSKKSE